MNMLPNVAIVGRPNVGKSALFNRLVGRKIAIVHDQPGITRDRLSGVVKAEPTFNLFDTGGIVGAGETELLREVERVVHQTIEQSAVIVLVVDARAGLLPLDQQIARRVRRSGKPVILAINKIDNDRQENLAADFDSLGFDRMVSISAEHNRGMVALIDEIERLLPSTVSLEDRQSAMENGLKIAVVGRPNVGKSSLINAIVNDDRAIVSELAGTTRDAIDISYERNGDQFVFIDTAGIRRRSRHSSSVEVFSVMRAERSVRRADICLLTIDLSAGVTAQDKRIAGLIQDADKACAVVLNKWDLVKPSRRSKATMEEVIENARQHLFFADYAPVVVTSAATQENVERVFGAVRTIRSAAKRRIGTGVLNRALRAAFAANPPPMRKGKRLKLFYAAQSAGRATDEQPGLPFRLGPPEFVLFVNDPSLITDNYRRYLEARIRDVQEFPGLPIILTLRTRAQNLRPRVGFS
jgi:GTP-binding protein